MPADPTPRMALCLAVDLKKSTATGLALSTKRLDRLNLALVRQFSPHLEAVGLTGALVKFTGDGWLVVSDNTEDAAPLCCLAIIMACRFQAEVGREAGMNPEGVPALRLAVCWGRDLPVELPGGGRDFVGDSVRHAVRACGLCRDNEILIDDTVLRWVHHDFRARRVSLTERRQEFPDAKMEQDLALHVLEELRPEAANDGDAPEYFINTLALIGRETEAEALAGRRTEGTESEAALERFNRLLASNLDYEAINRLLRDMREAGLQPDVRAFNSLIAKAADYDARCRWYMRMRQDNIAPDIRTFHTLVIHAPDEIAVDKWLRRMRKAGILPDTRLLNALIDRAPSHGAAQARYDQFAELVIPDATTFDLLIEKSPDVATGRQWVERMARAGFAPGTVSLRSLFARPVGALSGDELLGWFLALPHHPAEAIWNAIAQYRKAGRIADALRLCLDYPQTQAAQRVFRDYPGQTLTYLSEIVESNPQNANGAYALGYALRTLNREPESLDYLQRAFELALPGPRREELRRLLGQTGPSSTTPVQDKAFR